MSISFKEKVSESIKRAFDIDLSKESKVKIVEESINIRHPDNNGYVKIYVIKQLHKYLLPDLDIDTIGESIKSNIDTSDKTISDIVIEDGVIKIKPSNEDYYKDAIDELYRNGLLTRLTESCYSNTNIEFKKKIFISYYGVNDIIKPLSFLNNRCILFGKVLEKLLKINNNRVYSEIVVNDCSDDTRLTSFIKDIIEKNKKIPYERSNRDLFFKKSIDELLAKFNKETIGDSYNEDLKMRIAENLSPRFDFLNSFYRNNEKMLIKEYRAKVIDMLISSSITNRYDIYNTIKTSFILNNETISNFLSILEEKKLLYIGKKDGYISLIDYGDSKSRKIFTIDENKNRKYTNLFVLYLNLYRYLILHKYDKVIFIRPYKNQWEYTMTKIFMKAFNIERDIVFKYVGNVYDDKVDISFDPLYVNNLLEDKIYYDTQISKISKPKYSYINMLSNQSHKLDINKYIDNRDLESIIWMRDKLSENRDHYSHKYGFFYFNAYVKYHRELFKNKYFRDIIDCFISLDSILEKVESHLQPNLIIFYLKDLVNCVNRCLQNVEIVCDDDMYFNTQRLNMMYLAKNIISYIVDDILRVRLSNMY